MNVEAVSHTEAIREKVVISRVENQAIRDAAHLGLAQSDMDTLHDAGSGQLVPY